jgi:hypothetical protein
VGSDLAFEDFAKLSVCVLCVSFSLVCQFRL